MAQTSGRILWAGDYEAIRRIARANGSFVPSVKQVVRATQITGRVGRTLVVDDTDAVVGYLIGKISGLTLHLTHIGAVKEFLPHLSAGLIAPLQKQYPSLTLEARVRRDDYELMTALRNGVGVLPLPPGAEDDPHEARRFRLVGHPTGDGRPGRPPPLGPQSG